MNIPHDNTYLAVDIALAHDLHVAISTEEVPESTPRVASAWDKARKANPRLFDGPVLSFVEIRNNIIHARLETYQRLTVQTVEPGLVEPPVRQLSVTGVMIAGDGQGLEHVLLGRRSHETRLYGGLWEFVPGGGIDAPKLGTASISGEQIFEHLLVELREEAGLTGEGIMSSDARVLGLAPDEHAGSVDIVIRVDLPQALEEIRQTDPPGDHAWEHEALSWIAMDALGEFVSHEPVIPPVRAIARELVLI